MPIGRGPGPGYACAHDFTCRALMTLQARCKYHGARQKARSVMVIMLLTSERGPL